MDERFLHPGALVGTALPDLGQNSVGGPSKIIPNEVEKSPKLSHDIFFQKEMHTANTHQPPIEVILAVICTLLTHQPLYPPTTTWSDPPLLEPFLYKGH